MPNHRKPASTPKSAAPRPTLAEVQAAIAAWTDLSDRRRRDLASALSCLARLEERPPEAVRLDPVDSLALLERAGPVALGIAPATLANRRAAIRFILRRLGLLAPMRVRTPAVSDPAWAPLLAALPAGPNYGRLRALAAHCAAEGIAPHAVSGATLDAYAERRAAERGGAKARDHARRVGVQWNQAAREVPGWPATRLGLRETPLQYSLDFVAYPPPLQAETKTYLQEIGAPADEDLFVGAPRAEPVKRSTVITRKYSLRRLLWGAVQSGIPAESLTGLRRMTEPDVVKAALNWHYRRAGQVNADLGQMAATIASIAKYLQLPDEEWAVLKPLLAKATPPPRTEITDRTARLLDQLADPVRRAKLLHLPTYLLQEAAGLREGRLDRAGQRLPPQPEAAAWLAATAVAIEILLHAPMRLVNLQELRIGRELVLSQASRGRWQGTIFLDGVSVKNKRRLEVPLQPETMAVIRSYLDLHRPALPAADSTWLFPGQAGPERPRHKGAFGQAITEAIEQHVGVRLNPHAFRAFAGAIILEANPHAIDDVRAILGHACFETAMIYYRRCSQRDAASRLSSNVAGQRRLTQLDAAVHFRARDLRCRARRA